MVFIQTHNDHSRFDPNGYHSQGSSTSYLSNCYDCTPVSCGMAPFASYDASGDLMQWHFAESGYFNYSPYYTGIWVKASDSGVPAERPFYFGASPCCYSLLISGATNRSVSQSWCQSCNRINKVAKSTIITRRNALEWPTSRVHNQNIPYYFPLCDTSDNTLTVYDEYGSAISESDYSACGIHGGMFYVNVEKEGDNDPKIVAYFWLIGTKWAQTGTGGWNDPYSVISSDTVAGGWKKEIATYNGDYARYITNEFKQGYDPLNDNYGEHGTYDGREFAVSFSALDRITNFLPYSGQTLFGYNTFFNYELDIYNDRLIGLCEFGSTTISISPGDDTHEVASCMDNHLILRNFCADQHVVASSITGFTLGGTPLWSEWKVHPISNTATAIITGVSSRDSNEEDHDPDPRYCKKCENINDTYNLKALSYPYTYGVTGYSYLSTFQSDNAIWSWNQAESFFTDRIGLGGVPTPGSTPAVLIDTCCECAGSSICIDNMYLSFTERSGVNNQSRQLWGRADLYDRDDGFVARFERKIKDTPEGQAMTVTCDDWSFNLPFASGVKMEDEHWQRCSFDGANVNITFGDNSNLEHYCEEEYYTCFACADGYAPISLALEFTGIEYNGPFCHYDAFGGGAREFDCGEVYSEYDLYVLTQNNPFSTSNNKYDCFFYYGFPSVLEGASCSPYWAGGIRCPGYASLELIRNGATQLIVEVTLKWGNGHLKWRETYNTTGTTVARRATGGLSVSNTPIPYINCDLLNGVTPTLYEDTVSDKVEMQKCYPFVPPTCVDEYTDEWTIDNPGVTIRIV